MKRTKFLAMTLTAAVMLMGAGYAYWSDTLTINNTVSTGELNVKFAGDNRARGGDDQKGTIADGKTKAYWAAYVDHEGLNSDPAFKTQITDNGKTITTVVGNMYPGAYAQYHGTIVNDGTIPAVFKDATVIFTGKSGEDNDLTAEEQELKDNLKFAFGYKILNSDNTPVATNPSAGDGRFYASGSVAEMTTKINTLLTDVRLEPGQKLSLDFPSTEIAQKALETIKYPYNEEMECITYTLNPLADDDIELQSLGIHITINWKQHNE